MNTAHTIQGKSDLIRAAARVANVLILSKGPIEAYFQTPSRPTATDFEKQQHCQRELDGIWTFANEADLRTRYSEILTFIEDAGLLQVPISEMAKEPIANLVHLLQTEIAAGRIKSTGDALNSSRAVAEGYWHICDLSELVVESRNRFRGVIEVKQAFGNEVVTFDHNTKAYEIAASRSAT